MQRKARDKKKKEEEKKKNKKEDKKEDDPIEDIIVDENPTKDFAFLANATISEDDHFVFKSEKSWSIDVSRYSEYFLLDLKTLSAAIESIPYTENVNIDKKYFTNDQLTNIYNKAEKGKENYKKILDTLEAHDLKKTNDVEEAQESVDDTEEDLDFLLSLEEPVAQPSVIVKPLLVSHGSGLKFAAKPPPRKPMDLEKWLDSVLDD